jgi:XTP/dITP diphosphohydrolase
MKEIVVATNNEGKVAELRAALANLPVQLLSLRDFSGVTEAVEDGGSFQENALLKAGHYCRQTGKPCLADDSGLMVDALEGAPGVFSARYAGEHAGDEDNNRKLLAELAEVPAERRSGRFCSVLAFCDVDGTAFCATGSCEGLILKELRGKGGFGYDPLFYLPAMKKTMAELSLAEKNAVSHRGKAVREMAGKLREYLP